MGVSFNDSSSKIYDMFVSLHRAHNIDCSRRELENNQIEIGKDNEYIIKQVAEYASFFPELMQFFFSKDVNLYRVFIHEGALWESKTLEDYLKYLRDCNSDEIKLYLFSQLLNADTEDEALKGIIKDEKAMLSTIKKLDISPTSKWNLFSFIDDLPGWINKFNDFMLGYQKKYNELYSAYKSNIKSFKAAVQSKVETDGNRFLQELLRNTVKPENFENIRIWTSYYLLGVNIAIDENSTLNVFIGNNYEEIRKKLQGSNEVEQCLIAFKNISDKTRFEILKLLLKEEHYGQQLAEKLGITTATVSYHINYLTSANLITLERRDHRIYYILNKAQFTKLVKFLKSEFELEINII
ncbi:MAG: ArsR/SmtB family transcription factor [Bacillota bacterium]